MAISSAVAKRLKEVIYAVPGEVQAETERLISESPSYVRQRLRVGSIDPNQGDSPVRIRYATAKPQKAAYINIRLEGTNEELLEAPNCAQVQYGFPAQTRTRGSPMCNLPATTIHGGYDTFGFSRKARAWETDPICPWDFLDNLDKGSAYFNGLKRDLPIRAMDEFSEALEDEVLAAALFNFSMVGGFTWAAGQYPAVPTGTLDIGYIKRIKRHFEFQRDWRGEKFEIEVGEEALYAAINAWNTARGYAINLTNITGQANTIIGRDTFEFEGIRFVINPYPTRGWLRTTALGQEFVRVDMDVNRSGTGDGVVAEANNDYENCFTICDGQRHELFEVAKVIHPMFAERRAMAPMIRGDIKLQFANMEMHLVDGAHIECNKFNEKFHYAMRHVYEFAPINPELAGFILYRVAPAPISVVATTCPADCEEDFGPAVTMSELPPPPADECSDEQWAVDETPVHDYIEGTMTDPEPDQTAVGVIHFVGLEAGVLAEAGTMYVVVERKDGYAGAATVDVTGVSGTATSGVDFTALSETLEWADGENGRKRVAVEILGAATPGQVFTITLSGVTGATLDAAEDTFTATFIPLCPEPEE